MPIGLSDPTTRALKKCATSIVRKGSSGTKEQIRDSEVIKSLEKEFPKEFVSAIHKQGHTAKASNQLGTSDVVTLSSEAKFKTSQIHAVNKLIIQKLGGKIMHKEEDVSSKMKELSGRIEFTEFDGKAFGNIVTYCYKNVDEVLSKFFIDDGVFNDRNTVKHVSIAAGSDHGKGFFTTTLPTCIELNNEVDDT